MSKATIDEMEMTDRDKAEWLTERYHGSWELFIDPVAIYDALAKAAAPADEPALQLLKRTEELLVNREQIHIGAWAVRAADLVAEIREFLKSDAAPGDTAVSMATHATEAKATAPSTSDGIATEQLVELPCHFHIKPGSYVVKEKYRCRGLDNSPSTSDPRANCPWKCRLGAPKCTCAQPPAQQPAGTPTRWECFCDASYYHYWAVRQAGETRWGHCFHVVSKAEAEGLRDLLNRLSATQTKEGTDDE